MDIQQHAQSSVSVSVGFSTLSYDSQRELISAKRGQLLAELPATQLFLAHAGLSHPRMSPTPPDSGNRQRVSEHWCASSANS